MYPAYYQDKHGIIPYVILRYAHLFGPGKTIGGVYNFIDRMKRGLAPTLYGGKQSNDWCFVKDVARAIVEIAKRNEFAGQTVNVASGVSTSINDLMDMLCELTGYAGKVDRVPSRVADVMRHQGDVSKLESIGFKPMWSLEAGLARTVRWYKRHFESRD